MVFAVLQSAGLAADSPEPIPALEPPRGMISPSFWERYGVWILLSGVVVLAVAGVLVRILSHRKPPVLTPPEWVARAALEPLKHQTENAVVLGQVGRLLRHYFVIAFSLPGEQLTTAEFCRLLAQEPRVGPELAAAAGALLRGCDERRFSPQAGLPVLGAVEQALRLIELAQVRRAPAPLAAAGEKP